MSKQIFEFYEGTQDWVWAFKDIFLRKRVSNGITDVISVLTLKQIR